MSGIEALWQSIGEMPDDQLRRLVVADYYEERAEMVPCRLCGAGKYYPPTICPVIRCSSTGRVPNGYTKMAEALRATADRVPRVFEGRTIWGWNRLDEPISTPPLANKTSNVTVAVFNAMVDFLTPVNTGYWRDYPTASAAILNLCRAWVKVHKGNTANA